MNFLVVARTIAGRFQRVGYVTQAAGLTHAQQTYIIARAEGGSEELLPSTNTVNRRITRCKKTDVYY